MNLQPRPYRGLDDLPKMKALISEGRKVFPHSRYPHPGEVDWWVYFGVFVGDEPFEKVVTILEDGDQMMAWGFLEKPNLCDLVLHPSLRDTEIEVALRADMETRVAASVKDTD